MRSDAERMIAGVCRRFGGCKEARWPARREQVRVRGLPEPGTGLHPPHPQYRSPDRALDAVPWQQAVCVCRGRSRRRGPRYAIRGAQAVSGSRQCRGHGGGKRCLMQTSEIGPDGEPVMCPKSAQVGDG